MSLLRMLSANSEIICTYKCFSRMTIWKNSLFRKVERKKFLWKMPNSTDRSGNKGNKQNTVPSNPWCRGSDNMGTDDQWLVANFELWKKLLLMMMIFYMLYSLYVKGMSSLIVATRMDKERTQNIIDNNWSYLGNRESNNRCRSRLVP